MKSIRRSSGFTFIEISVVILAVVLMALIFVPKGISMMDTQRIEGFRLGAETVFRNGRSLAVNRRDDTELVWDDGLVLREATSNASSQDRASSPRNTLGSSQNQDDQTDDQVELDRLPNPNGLVTIDRAIVNGEEVDASEFTLRFAASGPGDSGGLQFNVDGKQFWVKTDAQGTITTGSGELEDTGVTEWDAGDLEQRVEVQQ